MLSLPHHHKEDAHVSTRSAFKYTLSVNTLSVNTLSALWLLSLLFLSFTYRPAQAAGLPPGVPEPAGNYCYAFNDNGKTLVLVDRFSGSSVWSKEVNNTQPDANEATTFDPASNTLYIVDQNNDPDRLMRVDLNVDPPAAIAIGTNIGTGLQGSAGTFSPGDSNGASGQSRVTGLTLNPFTGEFWAITRNNRLFKIDRNSGSFVPNAFGAGVDYVVAGIPFADDLTFNPVNGELWATFENPFGAGPSYIQRIDPATGAAIGTVILLTGGNPIGPPDPQQGEVEGLSFAADGQLYGVTGDSGTADGRLYLIPIPITDTQTLMVQKAQLPVFNGSDDYESLACLLERPVNLIVSKSHRPEPMIPGAPIQYTIVVTNTGPFASSQAILTDTIPAVISNVSWSCSTSGVGNTCLAPAVNGVGNQIQQEYSLAVNGVLTLLVNGTLAADAVGPIVNTVRVDPIGAGEEEVFPANNIFTDTATTATDLSISKDDQRSGYLPGGATTYLIVVSNNGPSRVENAIVSDLLPPAISSATWTCSATPGSSCGAANGVGSLNTTASLLVGGQVTYTVVATIAPTATGDLINTARVDVPAGITDENLQNNQASDINTLGLLALLKTATPSSVLESGGDVTFSIVVTNTSIANSVTVTEVVDNLYGDVRAIAGASCTPTLPALLAPGATVSCNFVQRLQGSPNQPHVNVATARGLSQDNDPLSASDDATVNFIDTPATIAVTKTANPNRVPESGGDVTFTIAVQNTSAIDRVTINEVVDSLFGNLINIPGAACAPALPAVLTAGATLNCSFVRTLQGDINQPHVNVALAAGRGEDGDPLSASDSESVTFSDVPASLLVSKTASTRTALPSGTLVTFTVEVQNNSLVDAVTINTIVDSLYGDVANAANPQLKGSTCTVPQNLPIGGSYQCQFSALLAGALGTDHLNVVTVTGVDADQAAVVGQDSETVTFSDVLLSASKRSTLAQDFNNNGIANPGDVLTYTVEIVNQGNVLASDLLFTDTVDVNTTLVNGSVQTSQGAVLSGNNPGEQQVRVALGTLAGNGGKATITFRVRINNPFPAQRSDVLNQGVAQSRETPPILTDDPSKPGGQDATVTPVEARPGLEMTKRDSLAVDADNNKEVTVGDTLQYQLLFINRGNTTALNAVFKDTPDPQTALVNGSIKTSVGQIVKGNNAGDKEIVINLGEIAVNQVITIEFRVVITINIRSEVGNQAIIEYVNPVSPRGPPAEEKSDDPDTTVLDDITITPISPPKSLDEGEEPMALRAAAYLPLITR